MSQWIGSFGAMSSRQYVACAVRAPASHRASLSQSLRSSHDSARRPPDNLSQRRARNFGGEARCDVSPRASLSCRLAAYRQHTLRMSIQLVGGGRSDPGRLKVDASRPANGVWRSSACNCLYSGHLRRIQITLTPGRASAGHLQNL
jgi:hypothetical protein